MHLRSIVLFFPVFILCFSGCSSGAPAKAKIFDTLSLNWTGTELFEYLEGKYSVSDTLQPAGMNNFYSIRFAPVQLFDKKAALMAVLYGDSVIRYDWFIDSVEDWTIPIYSSQRTLKEMRTAHRSDYDDLLLSLVSMFGKPDVDEGTSATWRDEGLVITYSLLLRSVHIERPGITGKVWKENYWWSNQRTSFDSSLIKFKLGSSKSQIKASYDLIYDSLAVLNGHAMEKYIALYPHWGIPGELYFIFDSLETNIGIVWFANTQLYTPTKGNTRRYYSQITTLLGESTSEYGKDGEAYWANDKETCMFRILPHEELSFSKYYNEWLSDE